MLYRFENIFNFVVNKLKEYLGPCIYKRKSIENVSKIQVLSAKSVSRERFLFMESRIYRTD